MTPRRAESLAAGVSPDAPARVLVVINDLALGGAQRVVLHQAATLDRTRFEVEVATFDFEPSGAMIPDFERAGIVVHRLRRAAESPWAGVRRLDRLIAGRRPALVHSHLAAAGVLARLVARRRGVPRVVTTLHNLSDWEEKRGSVLRWVDRRTLPLADAVITVSDAIRRAVTRGSPGLAGRLVTVRNGVPIEDLAGARAARARTRERLGFGASDFVVGTVARLDPRKGIDTWLEAIALARRQDPKLRGLLAGDGPERGAVEERLRTLGLEADVRWIRVPDAIPPLLGAMDVFAAPSRTEGLGLAIIEALAAGVPVIGSAVGGIPEVLEGGGCGRLLPPDQPRLWAETLVHLASDPAELERWAQAAPRRARAFSLEASGAELDRLYAGLLGLPERAEALPAAA